ncbi:MAG TPA: hypothetical protein VFE33_18870 [Thermoanaerobaculia bacterium]|nr:hypothetical protein [Thermoanaerobaculia bacterium]
MGYIHMAETPFRFRSLRRAVEILGELRGPGGRGKGKNKGQRLLRAEIKKRLNIDISGNQISNLYESDGGKNLFVAEEADKILSVLFSLFKEDPTLGGTVATLPDYEPGQSCLEIACPGLLSSLAAFEDSRADVAYLVDGLSKLTQACP